MKQKTEKRNLEIVEKPLQDLKPYAKNSRIHTKKQVHQIAKSLKQFGFVNPIIVSEDNTIIAGHGRYLAAKELGVEIVPTICISHLSNDEIRAYIIADNKLAENAGWDKEILKIELDYLMNLKSDLEFDATITGFELPEIDLIVNPESIESVPKIKNKDDFLELPIEIPKKAKAGDIWKLGKHRIICASSLEDFSFVDLLGNEAADMIFTDPPYNVKISGNVTKQKIHDEFKQASGEMTKEEFKNFLSSSMNLLKKYSTNGSIHYICMDWRHTEEIILTGNKFYSELKNICVWNKGSGGMGSLYRSQHEFIFVFKNGDGAHINNVELGKNGRYRTNVWDYPGMHSTNPQAQFLLKLHPTVKPVALIMDAILDCSPSSGIILDAFGGSGSTLIACERTNRKARLIEIEPKFVDVTIFRWEKLTNKKAELVRHINK